jgi:hypothetical protein
MQPCIDGVCLYPIELAVKPWGTIPSGKDVTTVPCSTRCEVKYADPLEHHLVCEPNKEGDFKHIFVTGMIRCKSNPSIEPYLLTSQSLDPKARIWWRWPNQNAFKQINAEYDIALKLVKTFAGPGTSVEWTIDQGPFSVKLLPPPDPIVPTPRV